MQENVCQGAIICKTQFSKKQWLKINRKWDHESNYKWHISEVTVWGQVRASHDTWMCVCGAQSALAGGTSLTICRANEMLILFFYQHFNHLGSFSSKISLGPHTSHLYASFCAFQPDFLERNVPEEFSSSPTFCINFTINLKKDSVHSTLRLPLLVNICQDH